MSEALSWNHWRANDIFCIHLIKQTFLSLCLDDDEYKSICCRTTFKSSFSSPITWTYHEQWSVRFLLLSLKNKQLCREKRLTCLEGKSFFLDICKTKFFFCLSLTRIFIFPDRSRQLVSSFSKKNVRRAIALGCYLLLLLRCRPWCLLCVSYRIKPLPMRHPKKGRLGRCWSIYIYISLFVCGCLFHNKCLTGDRRRSLAKINWLIRMKNKVPRRSSHFIVLRKTSRHATLVRTYSLPSTLYPKKRGR